MPSKKAKPENDWKHISDAQNSRICELEKLNLIMKECNEMLENEVKNKEEKYLYKSKMFDDVLKYMKCKLVLRLRLPFSKGDNREINSILMLGEEIEFSTKILRENLFELLSQSSGDESVRVTLLNKLFNAESEKMLVQSHMCLISNHEKNNVFSLDLNNDSEEYLLSKSILNFSTLTIFSQ